MKILIIALLLVMICAACLWSRFATDNAIIRRHDEIVNRALNEIPLFKSFQAVFPDSRHFITYISGEEGPSVWNSDTLVYGRYWVSMQAPVKVDRSSFRVTLDGKASFQLNEAVSTTPLPNGKKRIQFGESFSFQESDWEKVKEAKGDFSVIGIHLKKDQPILEFSDLRGY